MGYLILRNSWWTGWNLALALMPLLLSFSLFRVPRPRRTITWWIGVGLFLAFLPNAPYVLTDIVHLWRDFSAAGQSDVAVNIVLTQYLILFTAGFGAYAWSLWNLMRYLRDDASWQTAGIAATVLVVHGLCAVGVLLGRFGRFNSWRLATEPSNVAEYVHGALDDPVSWRLAAFTFVVLAVGTAVAHATAWGLSVAGRSLVRVEA